MMEEMVITNEAMGEKPEKELKHESINMLQAYKRIKESEGKICYAVFYKKGGEIRRMAFRTGVTKGVTGAGQAYEPEKYNLLTVFDMKKDAFRMINLEGLITLKINGTVFTVIP